MRATMLVVGVVLLLSLQLWAEGEQAPGANEGAEKFEVVIPKVTIDVKDAPVSQVLVQMSKQTDIELTADEDIGGKKLTLQVEDVPVLQALARLVKLTGAVIYWDVEEGMVLCQPFPDAEPELLAVAGPCLLTLYGTPWLGTDSFFSTAEGYVVSRPHPVMVSEPQITEVLDAEGKPVEKEQAPVMASSGIVRSVEDTRAGITRFSVAVGLDELDPAAPFPRTIRGTISLTFACEMADVTFDLNADIGQAKKVGKVEITYLRRRAGGSGEHGASYRFSVAGEPSRVRQFTLKNTAGRMVQTAESTWVHKGRVTEVELRPTEEAKTVTCQVILRPVTRTYPFEFKDTPRPEND